MGSVITHLERALMFLESDKKGNIRNPVMARIEIDSALNHYKVEEERKLERVKENE